MDLKAGNCMGVDGTEETLNEILKEYNNVRTETEYIKFINNPNFPFSQFETFGSVETNDDELSLDKLIEYAVKNPNPDFWHFFSQDTLLNKNGEYLLIVLKDKIQASKEYHNKLQEILQGLLNECESKNPQEIFNQSILVNPTHAEDLQKILNEYKEPTYNGRASNLAPILQNHIELSKRAHLNQVRKYLYFADTYFYPPINLSSKDEELKTEQENLKTYKVALDSQSSFWGRNKATIITAGFFIAGLIVAGILTGLTLGIGLAIIAPVIALGATIVVPGYGLYLSGKADEKRQEENAYIINAWKAGDESLERKRMTNEEFDDGRFFWPEETTGTKPREPQQFSRFTPGHNSQQGGAPVGTDGVALTPQQENPPPTTQKIDRK